MPEPEKERIYMLLDLLATVEDSGCEIIAESRRLRRLLRRVAAQKGHSGGEGRERVLAEVERRVVALGGLTKARRDDLLLVWKATRDVEGKVEGVRRRRTVAEGAAALWGWLWGGG
jgi:hypothetical protein